QIERAAQHVAPGGGDDGVGLRVHAAAELVALPGGDAKLIAGTAAELRTVHAAARRAVIARGDDLVIAHDDGAVFPPHAGGAVEHRVGDVEVILLLAGPS